MSARVVLIDSGVNAAHPHVREHGGLYASACVDESGAWREEAPTDLLGHGTAAAAAILDLAPGARLVSIRVFAEQPRCPFERVLVALERALDYEPALINLSLGTTRRDWDAPLEALLARAAAAGARCVSPAAHGGLPSSPGCLAGALGVLMDARLPRDAPEERRHGERSYWYASPYPRELAGLERGRNLSGISMACANLTGFLARAAG